MLKLEYIGTGEIFYATQYSAGFDFCAQDALTIEPKKWAAVKTGLKIVESSRSQSLLLSEDKISVLPELQIRPRSGLALRHGITVLNSPSTVDADYRGEIMVILVNHSEEPFVVNIGDRIAQGVCSLIAQLPSIRIKNTERGIGGFGSSGKN